MTLEHMYKFRKKYRANIGRFYSGWLHMLFVLTVAIAVISYALMQTQQVTLTQWLVFPLTMVVVNFSEYVAHRWLGHKKTIYGKLFYQRHSGDHHTFFLQDAMPYESSRDWRVVLFPSYLIIAFVGLILPVGWLLMQVLTDNTAYIFGAAAISGYVFYEVMHFSYHLPSGSFVEKTPGWKQLRQLHVEHHKRDLMTHKNFNITLPIFDVLFRSFHLPKNGQDKD
jgi:sterol desaturase/sphingolipid hydroxylase (fatty acid hydroxylase superfamily)